MKNYSMTSYLKKMYDNVFTIIIQVYEIYVITPPPPSLHQYNKHIVLVFYLLFQIHADNEIDTYIVLTNSECFTFRHIIIISRSV